MGNSFNFRAQLNALSFAVVSGTREISETLAVAAFLFAGSLSAGYELAGTLFLLGAVIIRLAVGFFSRLPHAVGGPQDVSIAIIATILTGLPATMGADGLIATAIAVCGATSVLTGVVFLVVGELRLAHLARILPYPVLAGFLAGSGWVLFAGGFTMALGPVPDVMTGGLHALLSWGADWHKLCVLVPALALALAIHVAITKWAQATLMLMVAATVIFYGLLSVLSISIDTARSWAWLPAQTSHSVLPELKLHLLSVIDWGFVVSAIPLMLTAAGLSTIGMLLTTSGLSLSSRADVNPNLELRGQGIANVVIGLLGGLAGFVTVGNTMLATRFGVSRVASGVLGALVLLVGLVFAGPIVSYMPNFLIVGIIMYAGFDMLLEWLYVSMRRLPFVEWCIILLIVLFVIFDGILDAILAGIGLSVVIFVYNYAKLPVIRTHGSVRDMRSNVERSPESNRLLSQHGDEAVIFALQGYLFFATAKIVVDQVRERAESKQDNKLRYVVMDFAKVSGLDSAAVTAFSSILNVASKNGFVVLFAGLSEPMRLMFERSQSIFTNTELVREFPDLDHAIEYCEESIISGDALRHEDSGQDAVSYFRSVIGDHQDLESVSGRFETERMKKGDYLIRRGEAADDIFVILAGRVRVQISLPDGRILRLRTMTSGAVVGDIAFYTNQRRTADVILEEDSIIMRVSSAQLQEIEKVNGALAGKIHRFFARTLAEKLVVANNAIQLSQR